MLGKLTEVVARTGSDDPAGAAPPATSPGHDDARPDDLPARPEPYQGHHVHLLGRVIAGPYASTDEDGGPLIELYEMVEGQDRHGRACMKPSLIGEFDRGVTRAQLLESEDDDLGPRWYRVMVRGADGTPIKGAIEDVDLRRPADRRRRMRRGRAERKPEPAPAAVGHPLLELQQRVDAAVEAERRRMQANADQVVGAVERERDHWRDRAERAETRLEALRQDVVDLRIECATLRAGASVGQPFDFDQLGQIMDKAVQAREVIDRMLPTVPATDEAPRPSLSSALMSGLRDLRGTVHDITELGTLIKGVSGGEAGFSFPRG